MITTTATIKRPAPVSIPEAEVQITIPEKTAQKLYGLLAHIRKYDGFDDVHSALRDIGVLKQDVDIRFIRQGLLAVESV